MKLCARLYDNTVAVALIVWTAILTGYHGVSTAAENEAEIAKKLNNPVAAMISVPFQFNYDEDLGPGREGERTLLNIQPVIPVSISEDWNLISRTILPFLKLEDVPHGNNEEGMGDITQSLFFSPKAETDGWIWGLGPALLLKTASDRALGSGKWGAGPTAVLLKQESGWTYGALVNHLWSFAGNSDRTDVDATFMQPFLSYTTSRFTTFTINSESTYDWEGNEWSVPVNFMVSQVFRIGDQPMSLQLGARYWADTPDNQGPDGWGWRLNYTLVFPKN